MSMHKPLFIGHGSPMNAIADNRYARFLRAYGQSIRKPEAIVVVSAHWLTKGTYITGNEHPELRKLHLLGKSIPGTRDRSRWYNKFRF